MPARVARAALVAPGHSFAAPRCRTSESHRTVVIDGMGLAGFKNKTNAFLLAKSVLSF